MSSETKSKAIDEEARAAVAPKLRFPEFREAEGWTVTPLGELGAIVTGKTPSTKESDLWGGEILFITPSDITEGEKYQHSTERTVVETSETKVLPPGSVVYTCIASIGKMALTVFPSVTNQQINAVVSNGKTAHEFVYYSLAYLTPWIQSIPATSTLPIINKNEFSQIAIAHPVEILEQKRVAECLSSVDEVIATQARKLAGLKNHKSGFIQQLFPREGETKPRLRFPEFLDEGEWEETSLGRLGELIGGLTYSPDDVRQSGLLVLRSSNVQNGQIALDDNVYVNPAVKGANLSQVNDILICVRNGSKALIGKSALIPDGMPLCTHGAFMTVFRAQTPRFVFQLFQTAKYQRQVAGDLGATINSINGSQFLKYKFLVPKLLEQQRIATFLSSLDDLIAAEAHKHEALKCHKRGLMQQLFPSQVEVTL